MFQNIIQDAQSQEADENMYNNKKGKLKIILNNIFEKKKIILYIVALLISTVQCTNDIYPFALAIFAATCANLIPMGIVYIITIIGTYIGGGIDVGLNYLLTSLIFIVMILIFKPWYQEKYKSERKKLGIYVFLSSFLVQASKMLFTGFLIYNLFSSILTGIITYIFYKIFANSLNVIKEFSLKNAFSIEEVVGASLMLAIAVSAFGDFQIFGLAIREIMSIIIILVLGWKHGILLGATSGITIGAVLGIIGAGDVTTISAYAFSGMLAGVLSKFGKFGVIVGFIAGNAIITYISNGNTQAIIYFKEIIVASLCLLLVPDNVKLNIEDFIDKNLYLPSGPKYKIEENKDTIYKLNSVSETIQEMSESYRDVAATIVQDDIDVKDKNQKAFLEELTCRMESFEGNILYDDILFTGEATTSKLFEILEENNSITRVDLINILKNVGTYIIEDEIDDTTKNDLKDMVQVINDSYKISKVNFIWKNKIKENKKVISNQLESVSKVISGIAKSIDETDEEFLLEKQEIRKLASQKKIDISDVRILREKNGRYIIKIYTESCKKEKQNECIIKSMEKILSKVLKQEIVLQKEECAVELEQNICKQIYISKDKYNLQLGIAKVAKDKSPVSGDTYIKTSLEDGKYLLAISDGMGSGPEARKSSKIAIKMLERLLTNGFDKDTSIKLINDTISLNSQKDTFATLDIAILDLFVGNIEFVKNGACPTFLKNGKDITVMKSLSLPAGILENIDLTVYDTDIEDNDIICMCTDGIIDSNMEYKNRELWVKDLLEKIETDNVQKIADIILNEAIDNNFGVPKDDMTVIVAKFNKI